MKGKYVSQWKKKKTHNLEVLTGNNNKSQMA